MTHGPLAGAAPSTRFLDPAVLASIGDLELLARTVVEGFLHGLHRSPTLGLSMEFAEHRPYLPGDDIRRIDWRVFARTDRFYVKEFEAETHASVSLVVDLSRSMAYGSRGVTKADYAKYLAASLAWFSARQRDRVGLFLFDGVLRETIPPSTRHLLHILHALDRHGMPSSGGDQGTIGDALTTIADRVRRRGIVVVVSDFYDDPEVLAVALGRLRATGSDVIAFDIIDPDERDFPFTAASTFEDLETGERLPVVPDDLRAEYQALFQRHQERLVDRSAQSGVDFVTMDTSRPLDVALYEYLVRRQSLARVR